MQISSNKKIYISLGILSALVIVGFILIQGPKNKMGGTQNNTANIPLINFNPEPVPANEIGKHPNILLVIADDMGLDADPCHPSIGDEKPIMPNLKALCDNGVTFDNVWVNPVCSPTRATMISGQYGFRTGVTDVNKILSPDTRTIVDDISDTSATKKVPVPYANAFIGKWHLSGENPDLNSPAALGVHYFAGIIGGGVRNYFDYPLIEQGVRSRSTTYTTTAFTDKAITWIQKQKQTDPNRPWFLWLAYNAPHAPFHMPPKDLLPDNSIYKSLPATSEDISSNPRKYYLAALEALDTEFGRLLTSISPEVLANTTIIFVGDNGTPSEVIQPPYSAKKAKASVYQGGVWGVLTVAGKNVNKKGVHDKSLVNSTDIFATVAELTGTISNAKDSVSFKSAFSTSDKATPKRTFIYTEWQPSGGPKPDMWAIRDNQFKLIQYSNGSKELYDLSVDPYESNDLLKVKMTSSIEAVIEKILKFKSNL